ncbi:hypothetical protein RchiOBHm_Chr5g0082921 [Rosa chinensis]|uniref:Uncharacterized protein n=1 Tax=Rosa chinensis TaxID=74649 RepID=A0A2P6QNE0_ROSCH|nr:hypothetical protein RchiOBHm_Chr5g0082921 [Rosa chinensis]
MIISETGYYNSRSGSGCVFSVIGSIETSVKYCSETCLLDTG